MLTPHSNTDTPGTVTCLPVAAVRSARAGGTRASVVLLGVECLKLSQSYVIESRRVFFSGYAFGYGPKTTGATLRTVSDLG